MTSSYDAVVIGGGILGAAVGYHLSKAGLRTALVDRGDPGHATWAGAGIVCPVTATVGDERLTDMAFAAAAYYPMLADELAEDGSPTGYTTSAMLSVSVGGNGADDVARTAVWADRVASQAEYKAMCEYGSLDAGECRAHCPALARDTDGGLLIGAAKVDGHLFRQSLLAAGQRLGLTILPGEVTQISNAGSHVESVITDGALVDSDYAVVCTGAWTERWLPLGAADPVITATRGEILHLQIDGLDTSSWPLVEIEGSGPYIIPWPDGRLAVGTTVDPTDDLDPRATLAGMRAIADSLARSTNGLIRDARLLECRVGMRPMSPDGLPLIGPWPGAERVLFATGHGANGLSWGPYTGKLVADMITGETPAIDIRPFAAGRFKGVGWKEEL